MALAGRSVPSSRTRLRKAYAEQGKRFGLDPKARYPVKAAASGIVTTTRHL